MVVAGCISNGFLGGFLTAEYVSKALIIYFPFVSTDMAIATEMLHGKTIFSDLSIYFFAETTSRRSH